MVAGEIERAFGIGDGGNQPFEHKISRAVQQNQVLLVFDSFEHLLDAATRVSQLIVACPGLTVLVTSRSNAGILPASGSYRWLHSPSHRIQQPHPTKN